MTVSSHGNGADRDHEAIREWPGRHGPVSAIACCAPRMAEVIAAELLLERFPQLHIIFTSGYSRDCDGRTANLAHTSYLQKPYSPTNLGRLVRKVLDVGVKAGVLLTNASLDAGRAALTVH